MAFPAQPEEVEASLSSAAERQRVRERFRATLAGLLELEVLRAKHQLRVDSAMGRERPRMSNAGQQERASVTHSTGGYQYHVHGSSGSLRVTRSISQEAVSDSGGQREIWAWSSWFSEVFLPLHQQQHYSYTRTDAQLRANLAPADSDTRASSGFCDDNDVEDGVGSSLSSSCFSLDSRPCSLLIQGREGWEGREHDSVSALKVTGSIPTSGFLSVANLCPESHWSHFSDMLQAQVSLDPRYCQDMMAGQSQEVYRFPSPLHAVALQSPLYACTQRPAQTPGSCPPPMYLTAGPWQTGCSPTSCHERHKLEEVILELAYRHHLHYAVKRNGCSLSSLNPASATPSPRGWQWPSLTTPRVRNGRGNSEIYLPSPPLGVSCTHKQSSYARKPAVM